MLKQPSDKYINFYDQARFSLTWNISVAIFLSMLVFVASLGFLAPAYTPPALIALVTSFVFILILKKTRKHVLVAKLFVIIGILLSVAQLFLVMEILHFVDIIWFLVIILFGYFTLGKKWGIASLVIFIVAISLFIQFMIDENIRLSFPLTAPVKISIIINAVLAGSILGFIINKFIKTTRYVELKYNVTNKKLKEQYAVIQSKNEESVVMLKEIHHRVKNNLQVITSLLRLQSRDIKSVEAKEHYADAISRIATMSLIHEKMYQHDLTKLDLNNYFTSLSEDLQHSFLSNGTAVTFEIDISIPYIGLKTIVPLALLYNELVSNSLKHAFEKEGKGKITFIGTQEEDGSLLIDYKDDGKWKLDASISSFGIELIQTFTEQLEGNYERSIESGTQYVFRIKNLD